MDRERDRDTVEELIESADARIGGGPDRRRAGQDDPGSRPVDGMQPAPEDRPAPPEDAPVSPDPASSPGPLAPH